MPTRLKTLALATAGLFACGFASSVPADAAPPSACDTARRYVARLQSREYDKVAELFSRDALFHTPLGAVLQGRKAIADFYKTHSDTPRILKVDRYIGEGRDCVFEMQVRMARDATGKVAPAADGAFVVGAMDHLTVDGSGRIARLLVMSAPASHWQPEPSSKP